MLLVAALSLISSSIAVPQSLTLHLIPHTVCPISSLSPENSRSAPPRTNLWQNAVSKLGASSLAPPQEVTSTSGAPRSTLWKTAGSKLGISSQLNGLSPRSSVSGAARSMWGTTLSRLGALPGVCVCVCYCLSNAKSSSLCYHFQVSCPVPCDMQVPPLHGQQQLECHK